MQFMGRRIFARVCIWNQSGTITILAKHGFGLNAKDSFEQLAKKLPAHIRLIAWDWIGYGETDNDTLVVLNYFLKLF